MFVLPDSYTTGAITNAWVPNGTSGVYIWGAQIEAGAFATSYIPTVAATVTRAADSASMTGTNFSSWFNASEGTFVVESTEVEGAGSSKSFAARKGATTSLIRAGRNFGTGQGSGDVFNAGSAQAQIVTANAWNSAAFNKIAFAYKLNDVGVSLNGGAAATDMIATIPTDCDELSIGTNGVGPIINGHIKSLTFFNTRKTNAELVTLST